MVDSWVVSCLPRGCDNLRCFFAAISVDVGGMDEQGFWQVGIYDVFVSALESRARLLLALNCLHVARTVMSVLHVAFVIAVLAFFSGIALAATPFKRTCRKC